MINNCIFASIDWTAIATTVIAIFTVCLWWSTRKLWRTTKNSVELTKQSVDLTQQEFIASHPPKIRVHSVYLKEGNIPPFVGIHNNPWDIQCFIDNIGGGSATIKESNLTFKKLKDPLPAILPFSDECHKLGEKSINPGEGITGLLTLDDETVNIFRQYISTIRFRNNLKQAQMKTVGETQVFNDEVESFYFFGYIDYLDNLGIIRRTAFCRQFNIKTKLFTKVEYEDYEYSY